MNIEEKLKATIMVALETDFRHFEQIDYAHIEDKNYNGNEYDCDQIAKDIRKEIKLYDRVLLESWAYSRIKQFSNKVGFDIQDYVSEEEVGELFERVSKQMYESYCEDYPLEEQS